MLLFIIVGVLFIWLLVITGIIWQYNRNNSKLTEYAKTGNIADMLERVIENTRKDRQSIDELKIVTQEIHQEIQKHIQKVGILRYNPFSDTGGDQSFVLAILDSFDNGVVLTSLHNRGITRWYAKNVKEGHGVDFELSTEEKQAIKKAVGLTKERKKYEK